MHESDSDDTDTDNDNGNDNDDEIVETIILHQQHTPRLEFHGFSFTPLNNISLNDKLSLEILSLIFNQLESNPRTLRRCTLVCRSWYELLGPRIWKAPRVLWSKHWSRFHPVTLMTTSLPSSPTSPTSHPDSVSQETNFAENLKFQQVSRKDLLTAMSLDLIRDSDRHELIQWFEWEKKKRKMRIKAHIRRRQLVMRRNLEISQRERGRAITNHRDHSQLNATDEEEEEEEEGYDEDDDETDDSDYDDTAGDDVSDDEGIYESINLTESDEDSESDLDYDASDDETPLMRLVSGIDYMRSLISNRSESQQLHSSIPSKTSLLSNPFSNTIARVRKRQTARETRQRLAELRRYDGLPVSLPFQTCGRWIQEINLHQETSNMQPHPVHGPLFPPTPSSTAHTFEPNNAQTSFPHLEQQEPPHRRGLFASFIDALTHNPHSFEDQFRGRKGEMRLSSRREFVTDKTLKTILDNCPRLCRLTISECHGISDDGFKIIRNSECVAQGTLASLHMSECYQITDQGLLNLVADDDGSSQSSQLFPRFESLDFAGCTQITDRGLAPLLAQSGNKLIQLRAHDCINITFKSVIAIAEHCHRIQWLDLGGTGKMNEVGLIQLASNCLDLEWLSLARPHPNNRRDSGNFDEGFNESGSQQNEEVDLGQEGDLSLDAFTQEDVTKDDIIDPPVSDYSIALICESCTKLQLLDVSYITTITNNAIESLSQSAKSLVYLTIIGCPGITSHSLYYLAALRNTSGKLGCITMGDALGISERDIESIMQGTLSGWQKSTVDETSLSNILSRNWG
ncbi:hypothetical protein BGZ76_002384 [Entomortierella beljakovae]|nr:hypothetical protein BGZ76_002384 [Entomortierella beljakovae]